MVVRAIAGFAALVIIAAIIAAVVIYNRRKQSQELAKQNGWALKGDLNASEEKWIISENNEAASLFRAMLAPPTDSDSFADSTLLSDSHRGRMTAWLNNHEVAININKNRGIGQ